MLCFLVLLNHLFIHTMHNVTSSIAHKVRVKYTHSQRILGIINEEAKCSTGGIHVKYVQTQNFVLCVIEKYLEEKKDPHIKYEIYHDTWVYKFHFREYNRNRCKNINSKHVNISSYYLLMIHNLTICIK